MTTEFQTQMTKGCPESQKGCIPVQYWGRAYTHPGFGGFKTGWLESQRIMAEHGWKCVGAFRFETATGDHATMDSLRGTLVIVAAA